MDQPQDLEAIGRLVQGLADFEKEPDAVHVTTKHYQNDGGDNHPLFYCLLLDTKSNTNNDNTTTYTCGMAFCYMGYTTGQGRHWYLEDLFLEPAYRGCGAGTHVMQTLARIAVRLDCAHLRWQALDWNQPALTFYQTKLGARILEGVHTWRWAGDDVRRLAHAGTAVDRRHWGEC